MWDEMELKTSVDQYGRKTWDIDAYAAEAKAKRQKTDESNEEPGIRRGTDRDEMILALLAAVNDISIVEGGTMRYKIGFVCPVCQRLFRDNLALVDHFNLPQHLAKVVGESGGGASEGGFKRSSYEDVEKALKNLLREKNKSEAESLSFQERVMRRKTFEEGRRQKRRDKKNSKKLRKEESGPDQQLQSVMGFTGFGSSNG